MICKICNVEMKAVTKSHLVKHDITTAEYISKYGGMRKPRRNDELLARLISFGLGIVLWQLSR